MKTELKEMQSKKQAALNTEIELETKLTELTGSTPHILSPENKPFAVFYPKTRNEYLTILNNLEPTDNAKVTFAGEDAIQTCSPYLITYGGRHDTPNYMEVCVKFSTSICPIWIKLPEDVQKDKFEISPLRGDHRGFGNYETKYTLHAKEGKTTIQNYWGDNKTMYAANEQEKDQLFDFITL